MSDPWLPPYLGSWEELVQALLHNPFLGSGHSGPNPSPWLRANEPDPHPWRAYEPVPQPWHADHPNPSPWLVYLSSLKMAVATLPEGSSRGELEGRIEQAISAFIDDYCGTGYRHWPLPGPPPWVLETASELTLVANALQEGRLRNEIFSLVGRIMEKAVAPQQLAERNGLSGVEFSSGGQAEN